ncbi:PASTA domain-containing protein [Rubrivirga litoralis]|uniref:PASTA domain-containing protein n=1 Tax=Rubrivirga litoralis TaxID=3075598 RepID=A0ABU3BQY5_9BACT|nr:PASTA domain-containing protein [Rubrivirga sp. F394]MDT0631694.1 PASTA domain-containing protein [Rubrivirga sp. F394]
MSRSRSDSPRSVVTDRVFWIGLAAIAVGLAVFVLLFNYAIMPIWTRHDATVAVPDVREMEPAEAERSLLLSGLEGTYDEQPYNPNVAPDIVVEQSPVAGTQVKPGRRIYYYVNVSPKELVPVPRVVSLSEGTARTEIEEAGLAVGRVEMDTVRTPYENTVTRQEPGEERQVPIGTRLTLWISPGVDNSREVTVPNVVGVSATEARDRLRSVGLFVDSPRAEGGEVVRQEPERGERLNPGEEVRIYTE